MLQRLYSAEAFHTTSRRNPKKAIKDYGRVIELPDAPLEQVAMALVNRGIAYGQQEKLEEAIENFGRVIELPGAPVEQVATALFNRGVAYRKQKKPKKAIEDYGRVIKLA